MQIIQNGSRASRKGPADWFTGAVRLDPLLEATEPARAHAGLVTFEPGARTNWHTHPLGQTIIIAQGKGLVQTWGELHIEVNVGDVITFAPGEKHWHGATPTTGMSHIVIHEALDGKAVDWLEPVTEAQYKA